MQNGEMYVYLGWFFLAAAVAVITAAVIEGRTRPRAVPAFWGSLAIWGLQVLVSMAAVFWVGFLGISTPHCDQDCEWDLLGNNFLGFTIAAALVQFVSIALIVILRRNRKVWIVPAAAIVLTLLMCVASSAIAYKAMLFF